MTEFIETLVQNEFDKKTFETIENVGSLSGLQSFNIMTAPSSNDCKLTSSTITYTKQLILSPDKIANISVVKTAIYREDNCGRNEAKVHEGTCITAKAIGAEGAMWTTTITVSLLDNSSESAVTFTKTIASDGSYNAKKLLATLTECSGSGLSTKDLA